MNPKRTTKKIRTVRELEVRIVAAARKWWRRHRPLVYGVRDHINNPTVNTGLHRELAEAVAEYETDRLRRRQSLRRIVK